MVCLRVDHMLLSALVCGVVSIFLNDMVLRRCPRFLAGWRLRKVSSQFESE